MRPRPRVELLGRDHGTECVKIGIHMRSDNFHTAILSISYSLKKTYRSYVTLLSRKKQWMLDPSRKAVYNSVSCQAVFRTRESPHPGGPEVGGL